MSDNQRGIYSKFHIERTDGSSAPGGKHERCAYFALDLEHDPFAIPALKASAAACAETHPELARDVLRIASSAPGIGAGLTPSETATLLMTTPRPDPRSRQP